MAYQPKFAKQRGPVQAKPAKAPVKKKKRINPFFILLGLVVVPLSVLLTWDLLQKVSPNLGRPADRTVYEKTADMVIMDRFDTFITNEKSDALDGVMDVKKRYWLSEDTKVAPEPDQSKFGETDDPSTLGWLLEEAAELLEGQSLYFSLDTELFKGSKVQYYLDESILAITWKEAYQGTCYTVSEVKIAHPLSSAGIWQGASTARRCSS